MGIVSFLLEKLSRDKTPVHTDQSVYDFKMKSLTGKEIDFSQYKGKNLLLVNTASKCGFTPQYAQLQQLHEKYSDKVTVLGFPSNNFLWEEPGSNAQISEFCEINYGVTFQMFEKISVKGKHQHPLYQWLEAKTGKKPSWNFCKYLIDKEGHEVRFFPSSVNPLSKLIIDKISL